MSYQTDSSFCVQNSLTHMTFKSIIIIIIIIIVIKRIVILDKHFNNYNIAVVTVCPVSYTLNEVKRESITLKILKTLKKS